MHAVVGALRGSSTISRPEEGLFIIGHRIRGTDVYMSTMRPTQACLFTTAVA